MKSQDWSIDLDGKMYEVNFIADRWRGRHKLVVNGEPVSLHMDYKARYLGIVDVPFSLGNAQARLVIVTGKKADLVVNGVYLDHQCPYVPIKIPVWAWFFVFFMLGISILSLGGAIPGALSAVGALLCIRFSVHPTWNRGIKWLACVLCVVLFYAIWFGFQLIMLGVR